jgi:hypothetical protein
MTAAERVHTALAHREGALPFDMGSTFVTGIHASCVAGLRRHYGLEQRPVRILDLGQMLGALDEDLKQAIGVDVEGVFRRGTKFGVPAENWKPWRMPDGLEVLVPGGFNTTVDENGDVLAYPQGDLAAPPSGRMPARGYFFDAIIRQPPLDEARLDPADNLEEFTEIAADEIGWLEREAARARATGRAVMAGFGGTSFGDIAHVPGMSLKQPRGIRDVAEWYISVRSRRGYIHKVFEGQCEIALKNLQRIAARVGGMVDVINICGTDFGTQTSSFCSVATFNELWMPYYKRVTSWIHANTSWKVFKHSCGAVAKFIPSFLECGFDILNPVQCSAAGMDPETLKSAYGDRIVFWGGGVDTQKTLPFGAPGEVRDEVLRRCDVFARGGGFVFNTVHNIQAATPVENIVALIGAVHEFRGAA